MIPFSYKAMNASGRIIKGRTQAVNAADLEARIKRMGLDFICAAPAAQRTAAPRVPRRELINLYFHLEQLLRAGIPLIEALVDLRNSVDDARLRTVLAAAIESIEGGKTLSQAMAEQPSAFDEVSVHLVRAGELAGRLPEVLVDLVETLKWQDELAAQAKRLAAYPLFLGALLLGLTFFMMTYLVPKMIGFVRNAGQQLPWHTELLIAVSDLTVRYWPLLLGVPLALAVAMRIGSSRSPRFRLTLDGIKLRLPLLGGVLRKIVLSRFAAAFAMMTASGIPVLDALRAGESIAGNAVIAGGLRRGREMIVDGASVADAFERTGTFPPLVIRMLHVGESCGTLDRALSNVSYFYHRDVQESVDRVRTLVEPVMTVVIGIVMGWIMLSVLGPIYDVIAGLKV